MENELIMIIVAGQSIEAGKLSGAALILIFVYLILINV